MVELPAEWLAAAIERLQELLDATDVGFYPKALDALIPMLADPIFAGTPMPFISPIEGGGISAEFRSNDVELHIEFDGEGRGSVYAYQRGGTEWEGSLNQMPDGIEKWAWRLAQGSH